MGRIRRWLYEQQDAAGWPRPGMSPVNRVIAGAITLAVLMAVLESEREKRTAALE